MRRGAAIVIALGLALTAAGSASAAPDRSSSGTAQAFWHTKTPVSDTTYRMTTWYVGVYFDKGFSWSDLYQEVDLCRVAAHGDRCRQESFEVGFSDLRGSGETFTMEATDLTGAHLEAKYLLQSYDQFGNPVGDPERYSVVSDWTGVGEIVKSHGKDSWHSGCYHFTYSFKGKNRSATSTGSLNGTALGRTRVAFMATDVSRSVTHDCH